LNFKASRFLNPLEWKQAKEQQHQELEDKRAINKQEVIIFILLKIRLKDQQAG